MQMISLSRRESFEPPAIRLHALIAQTIVQAIGPALPELDGQWTDAVAAPVRRPRHFAIGESLRQFAHALFQHIAAGDDLALSRCPGAQPAAQRTAAEIAIRFRLRKALNRAFNAHLPLHLRPE